MKIISIIIPVFNEAKNIPIFHRALLRVVKKITNYVFEIIYIDDGSQDDSIQVIKKLSAVKDDNYHCRYIQFSRNFGKEMATTAGLNQATGDAVMMIDVDLQHPPQHIPEFITKWEKGAEIVIGVRNDNHGEGLIKKFGSIFFYKLVNLIATNKIKPKATDFRLLDKKVIAEFNKFTERNRITRGLIDWMGFQRDYVYFASPARQNGKASYNTLKLINLAIASFVGHSLVPLKLAGYLGIIIIALSGPLGLFIFVVKYILGDPWGFNFSGPAILAVIILFLVGIILICLGLITLYIANIHIEVNGRPMYVIREKK